MTVIGAGSWGTALAISLARNNVPTRLWGNEIELQADMARTRCNAHYLPGIDFPESLTVYTELEKSLQDVRDILLVVPSHAFREVLNTLKPLLPSHVRIAWATKGLDPTSNQLLHTVVYEVLGESTPVAVLSGPTFAAEVAAGKPSALALASTDAAFAESLSQRFHSPHFRVYRNDDIIGVQLGGALKNVLAIATGISDGLELGANARCALVTRGLNEIMHLGQAMGAQSDTFMGLAGLGDLVLTCTDNQSRNRRFGLALGRGETVDAALKAIGQVVEGRGNAAQAKALSEQYAVEMPILMQVYEILYQDITPRDAVTALLMRPPTAE